jgi:type IV secretory pathway VirD2 relaxase
VRWPLTEIEDRERPFRLRPRKPKADTQHIGRRWGKGLRGLFWLAQGCAYRIRQVRLLSIAKSDSLDRTNGYMQRCAVRVTYSRNKTGGQWKAHGRYLARESVAEKAQGRVYGFDAKADRVDIVRRLDGWQREGDERLFKLIISPEFADRMNLPLHTRGLLRLLERDLSTKLEWVAVVHRNTDHLHVHVVLRGRDESGCSLRLPREYIKSRIRSHAEDLATKQLGYRTERDALEAQCREISQQRFTTLDRTIQRHNSGRVAEFSVFCNLGQSGLRGRSLAREQHLAARLARLEQMGLARSAGHCEWAVRGDFESLLRVMQTSSDRQRVLAKHGAFLSDARLPIEFVSLERLTRLEGRVVAHRQGEGTDRGYLMLEGTDGKVHLLYSTEEIQKARHEGKVMINSFVRIEKRFCGGVSYVRIDDLGDAYELLKSGEFHRMPALAPGPINHIAASCGGWLGRYQEAMTQRLSALTKYDRGRN